MDLDGFEIMYNFLRTTAHIREIGAAAAICGFPVAGWFARRFIFISQVGCRDCAKELGKRRNNANNS